MAATLWFYVRDDKRQGPVDFEHLVTMLLAGQIPHNALVWHQGLREWSQADAIPEIAEQLPPPLPQGPRPAKPPAVGEVTRSGETGPIAAVTTAVPPRIDELRKRLEKDPGSRLFAQLAEELRKEGQLEEAIAVCRVGLQKHPSYPSARITLGRALIDSGDPAAARVELETVVQSAPENILARKLLDECLVSLGLPPSAPPALRPAPVATAQTPGSATASSGSVAPAGPSAAGSVAADSAAQPSGKWWRSLLGAPAGALSPPVEPAPMAPAGPPVSAAPPAAPEDDEPPPPPRMPDEDLPPIPLVAADDEPFELAAAYDVPVVKRPGTSGDTGPLSVVPPSPPSPPPAPPLPSAPSTPSAKATAPQPPVPPSTPPPLPPPGRPPKKTPSDLTALLDEDAGPPRIFVPSLMPPTGSLADTDFPDLIHALHDRRWTGTIELNRGRVDSTVTVQNGRLTFATSTNRDERLGELLLRKEKITLRQYYAAGKAIRKGKRLGAVLVEQGALDARDLVKAVVDHTQEVIYSVFLWTEGFYRLREGLEGDGETITLKLSTANIILEGIRRITAWSRIERGIGGPDARYVRADDYKDRLPEMTLTPEKLLLLAGHEGERDVDTLCRESQLSDYEVCRTIWAFRVIGVLKQVPPAGPGPS